MRSLSFKKAKSRIQFSILISAVMLTGIWWSASAAEAPVLTERETDANSQRIAQADNSDLSGDKTGMQKTVEDLVVSLQKILSNGSKHELNNFYEATEKLSSDNAYVFFVTAYPISKGIVKYKIDAHPNSTLVGSFAKKNVVAMNYVPAEDFFEEDCEQATHEGKWFGPYRLTEVNEKKESYQVGRKSMFYRSIPNTNHIVVGVVIEGERTVEARSTTPNRFIQNGSKSLSQGRDVARKTQRMRKDSWNQAKRGFAR